MRSGAASSGFLIRLLYDEYGRACVAERFFALFVIAQITAVQNVYTKGSNA